jgi:hypothetical protein
MACTEKMHHKLRNKATIKIRFGVYTAITTKNSFFWDIKTQFVPHRRHITSPLQSTAGQCYVRFEVFTVVTEAWDVTPCALVIADVSKEIILSIVRAKNQLARNNVSKN